MFSPSFAKFGPALLVPLKRANAAGKSGANVLIILHVFYIDVAERMICRLASLNASEPIIPMRLIITTNSASKAEKIEKSIARWSLCAPRGHVIELHPNRGRNVAPFLAACRMHARDDDLILHLHTKRSPHAADLAGWGEYLFDCLAGSRSVVESIMEVLMHSRVGLLYPPHYRRVANEVQWGPNFESTKKLLDLLNVPITRNTPLDFPSGMMFWTRLSAINPLLNLGLDRAEFDSEAGQTDGTLAHAVERAMIYVVEQSDQFAQSVLWSKRVEDYWGSTAVAELEDVTAIARKSRLLGRST